MNWTLEHLVDATSGRLVQAGEGPFAGVSTDSRGNNAGKVFLALTGPHFDGHLFVGDAVRGGATGAIVSRDLDPVDRDVAWIRVDDGLRALGDLALHGRREFAGRVIAVTGSNGKTTTRKMIASIVEASGKRVTQSAGNENNLVGLPQTLLRLEGDEDFAVLEMGMNRPGEIWRLTEIARPDVGVLTNVGPAHLEGVGTIEDVARAKGEMARAMRRDATLVVNAGDSRLRRIAADFPGPTILAGEGGSVRAFDVESQGLGSQTFRLDVEGRRVSVRLPAPGRHNVTNALVAAGAAAAVGIGLESIARGLERFTPPPMRLERVALAGDVVALNDAYNANPASTRAALETLAAEPAELRIAVLSDMEELGETSARWHREVGAAAATAGVDRLVAVGQFADETAAGAVEGGLDEAHVVVSSSTAEAADVILSLLRPGSVVLLKGSRKGRLEEVLRRLGGGSD